MKRLLTIALMALVALFTFAQPPRHGQHHSASPRHSQQYHAPCATPEQMAHLLRVLNDLSFDEKKADVACLCVSLGEFCTRDLEQIAKTFNFDEHRLEFLKCAYSYCTDPQNYPFLRDVFTFQTNYDELLHYIRPMR